MESDEYTLVYTDSNSSSLRYVKDAYVNNSRPPLSSFTAVVSQYIPKQSLLPFVPARLYGIVTLRVYLTNWVPARNTKT